MALFKSSDPAAALAKTEAKIASVKSNIDALRIQRAQLLLEADDPADVVRTDKALEAEEANLTVLADRVRALKEEIRKQEYQNREKQRAGAIARVSKKLERRGVLAAQLQEAISTVGRLYVELITPDEAEHDWPFPKPGHGFALLDRRGVNREVGWALHGLVHQHRLPEPSSAGLGVVGITAQGIDGVVRQQNDAILSRLETAPIAEDLLEETA